MRCVESERNRLSGSSRRPVTSGMVVAASLLLLGGCKNISTTTTVEPNGAMERHIVMQTDSEELAPTGYPLPSASDVEWSYQVNVGQPETEDAEETWLHEFRRRFRNAGELDSEIRRLSSEGPHLTHRVEIRKRYRWFTTYLVFREVFDQTFPYNHIPLSDYLTEEELEVLRGDDAPDEISDRAEEWLFRNVYEDLYLRLLEAAGQREAIPPSLEALRTHKEELFQALMNTFEEIDFEEIVVPTLQTIGRVMEVEDVTPLRPAVEAFEAGFLEYEAISEVAGGESYDNTVVMPGLLVGTNAPEVVGNRVTWRFDAGDLDFGPIEMWVESRVTNRTAVWLAAFAAVLLLVLLVVGVIRRRSAV